MRDRKPTYVPAARFTCKKCNREVVEFGPISLRDICYLCNSLEKNSRFTEEQKEAVRESARRMKDMRKQVPLELPMHPFVAPDRELSPEMKAVLGITQPVESPSVQPTDGEEVDKSSHT